LATALAKRLQMTQPAIARLESGEHNPTFPTLLRLSDALGIEHRATTNREPRSPA
jgi:transcriptional regulator with XRE-family HTH domain